jgi:hypothetical protein
VIVDPDQNTSRTQLLAVGPQGLEVVVPDGVALLPVARPAESDAALSVDEQRAIVRAALAAPQQGPALAELAKGHRRAVILVGGLALPAPYEVVVPPLLGVLLAAEIRPSRIALLACPGASGPVLGIGAIRRYGEEVVGEYDLRAWEGSGAEPDSLYAAADLRVAVTPALPARAWFKDLSVDLALTLGLGRKLRMDVASARASQKTDVANEGPAAGEAADVLLTSGGGADWETTLEEALLSLHTLAPACAGTTKTVALAFSGIEGLGSAQFARDLWGLLQQAEELLAKGEPLTVPAPAKDAFDPALTVAWALSRFEHLALLSPELVTHEDGEDLAERLAGLPSVASRIGVCAREQELWGLLERWHGTNYRLALEPLGWRA